jgi:folate-binding protein YgfZ
MHGQVLSQVKAMLHALWHSLTDNQSGEAAIANEDGLVQMNELCALHFKGSEVTQFLQGYLTCDTATLSPDKLTPAALCNLQGRVTAFGWALSRPDGDVLWLVHESLAESLKQSLRPYLAFSKTTLEPLQEDHLIIANLCGDGEGNIAERVHLELVEDETEFVRHFEELGAGQRQPLEAQLIRSLVPLISAPVAGKFLPQMLNLVALGAVDFNKGCYLGQEVVARAQHRGQVKRQLAALIHDGSTAATPGATILDSSGRSVGTVIQSVGGEAWASSLCVLQTNAESPFEESESGITMHG